MLLKTALFGSFRTFENQILIDNREIHISPTNVLSGFSKGSDKKNLFTQKFLFLTVVQKIFHCLKAQFFQI